MLSKLVSRGCLGLCLLAASGCFGKLRRDERVRTNLGNVQGRVTVDSWNGTPILVAAGLLPDEQGETLQIVRKYTLREPNTFGFQLQPGSYLLGAIEDTNGNGRVDDGERAVISAAIDVDAAETEVVPLNIAEVFDLEAFRAKHEVLDKTVLSEGDVLALTDAKFGPEFASQGMWEPTKYARERRPGVYMLEPYVEGKIPVLYVHGMVGYPQEFTTLIEGLDRSRFQPWIALYPSGLPLPLIAKALETIVTGLAGKHKFERMCIVAHSMGGLVSRQILNEHAARKGGYLVRGFVTLDSPLGGMPSAHMGTKMAPAVVPSWYDLDPHGKFAKHLYDKPLPDDIEYHLLFGFDDGLESDGVVQLGSQLRVEAQREAEVVLGYRATHTGILKSKAAAAQVATALKRCAGDENAPRVAPRPPEPTVIEDRRK
jgi:uncharacterized alpha/beta hydrolase family protein